MEIFLTLGLLTLFSPHIAVAQAASNTPPEASKIVQVDVSTLQEAWISKLSECESGDYDHAINPKDTDGTASLGTFQFKVTTYEWLLNKYDIPTAPIFSSTTQRAIVRRMINDPQIDISHQFPHCSKVLGLPPR